ncbi:MAG: peptide-methionine (S)-S-oxide reductase MsrA, partial [Candidatus Nanohaloarchaea archaeon]
MRGTAFLISAVAAAAGLLLFFFFTVGGPVDSGTDRSPPDWKGNVSGEPATATFAGGCFWCIEAVYDKKKGVVKAVSGYAGGREATANYGQVSTGQTGHREAVRVKYYPSVVSYEELLDAYWRSIDPTDPGGQFT